MLDLVRLFLNLELRRFRVVSVDALVLIRYSKLDFFMIFLIFLPFFLFKFNRVVDNLVQTKAPPYKHDTLCKQKELVDSVEFKALFAVSFILEDM
jgi:hypothetical protein